jgi:hypothetical protein
MLDCNLLDSKVSCLDLVRILFSFKFYEDFFTYLSSFSCFAVGARPGRLAGDDRTGL